MLNGIVSANLHSPFPAPIATLAYQAQIPRSPMRPETVLLNRVAMKMITTLNFMSWVNTLTGNVQCCSQPRLPDFSNESRMEAHPTGIAWIAPRLHP